MVLNRVSYGEFSTKNKIFLGPKNGEIMPKSTFLCEILYAHEYEIKIRFIQHALPTTHEYILTHLCIPHVFYYLYIMLLSQKLHEYILIHKNILKKPIV